MRVRMRFGVGFTVVATCALLLALLAGYSLYNAVVRGDPVAYLICAGTVALAWGATVLLRRALRSRRRTPLRLTADGMHITPAAAMAPLFVAWRDVAEVVYAPRSARGFTYHHEWHLRTRSGEFPRLSVDYPLGFRPGPWRIRRRIRRYSPTARVSTRDPGFIGF